MTIGALNWEERTQAAFNRPREPFVNNLSPDIMIEVFHLHAAMALPTAYHPNGPQRPWIDVTHVCQYWRAVALSSPGLWTHVSSYSHPELARLSLARSGNALLQVDYPGPFNHSLEPVLSEALSQSARVRSLQLSDHPHLQNVLDTLEDGRNLEVLSLADYRWKAPELPKKFLAGVAPRLTFLRLVGITTRWDDLPLNVGLTHLTIRGTPASIRPTIGTLTRSLAQLPHLQYLELFDFLPHTKKNPIAHPSVNMNPILSLPQLQQVYLQDETSSICGFFSITSFPITVGARITLTDTRLKKFALECCLRGLMDVYINGSSEPSKVNIVSLGVCYGNVGLFDTPHPAVDFVLQHPAYANTFHITISAFDHRSFFVPIVLSSLDECFNLCALQALRHDGRPNEATRRILQGARSPLKMVNDVTFESMAPQDIIWLLESDELTGPGKIVYPRLSSICFIAIDFKEGQDPPTVDGEEKNEDFDPSTRLFSLLGNRSLGPCHHQVDWLEFLGCENVGPPELRSIHRNLPNLKMLSIDGEEITSTYY